MTYRFSGPLDAVYSTLVVRLHHTEAFQKGGLWCFAADFQSLGGQRAGFVLTKKGEGAGELAVYFDPTMDDGTKALFLLYVHQHLQRKASNVVRLRHYVCPHCGTPVEHHQVARDRLQEGKKDIVCVCCEKRVPLWDLLEEKFASSDVKQMVEELEKKVTSSLDNESRELRLVGDVYAIVADAGQTYRQYTNSDHGIDGEIEFKNTDGRASSMRLYLQLKSGDSYLSKRKADGAEIFTIRKPRHVEYWQKQAYPVMLVIRTSDGTIRWMDVREYLRAQSESGGEVKQVVFSGEAFNTSSVLEWRSRLLTPDA